MSCVLHDITDTVLSAGGFSTDRAEETIMEAPKVPTLDIKNKRKPGGSVPTATDDDDRNLSVIDPGGNYGQGDVSVVIIEAANDLKKLLVKLTEINDQLIS